MYLDILMGKRIYLDLPKPGLINGVILTTKERGGCKILGISEGYNGIYHGWIYIYIYIYIYIHILAPPQNRERDLKKGRVKMSTVGKI